MVYIIKIEARASLLYTPTFQHNRETLRECEALKTLLTELHIIKNLTVDRLLKEERWEGPHTRFNLCTNMGRAIRVGGLSNGHYKRARSGENATPKKSISKIRPGGDSEVIITNGSE